MKTLVLIFVSFSALVSLCKSQVSNYSFKENYKLSLPAILTVSSSDGNIDVISSEGNEIEVLYIIKKNNKILSMSKEDLQEEGISPEVIHSKNSLELKVKYPVNYWNLNVLNRIKVNFEIHMPQKIDCNLNTSDGNISIQGMVSNQQCKTSDGNVHIYQVTGNISIKASDGRIDLEKINGSVSVIASDAAIHANEIEGTVNIRSSDRGVHLSNINGKVNCKTSDGNIELTDSNGDVSLKTSDGHISFINLSGSLEAKVSDGSVKGNFLELKNYLTVGTSDGNIDITIPEGLGLDLNVKGRRRNIQLENFSGTSEKNFMKGKINGGGIAVNLSTSDGRIILSYN